MPQATSAVYWRRTTSPAFFGSRGGSRTRYRLFAPISGNPAVRGQTVQLYANGLGPVTNQPATGDPAPSSPLAQTKSTPVVTIGGQTAVIGFSGLAPGFAGLYQINVTVPNGVTPGLLPLVVTIGGKTSKTSGIQCVKQRKDLCFTDCIGQIVPVCLFTLAVADQPWKDKKVPEWTAEDARLVMTACTLGQGGNARDRQGLGAHRLDPEAWAVAVEWGAGGGMGGMAWAGWVAAGRQSVRRPTRQ